MAPKKTKSNTGKPNGTHSSPPELQHSPYHYDASVPFEESYSGHCFCGTIQFSLSGDPLLNVFCHCRSCQRLHGAPSTLSSIYPKDRVRFTAGVEQLVFWSPQKRENGYTVPCKMTCGNCHSPIANEGGRTVLILPALIDFSKKFPGDKSKRDQVDEELPDEDQSRQNQDEQQDQRQDTDDKQDDKQDDEQDEKTEIDKQDERHQEEGKQSLQGQGRLPEAFRPDIHQHYETRIRDIQDDLPKFGKEKNKEPLNQAARDFMARSEREKKEKQNQKQKEEKQEEEEKENDKDERNDHDKQGQPEKHEKTPPKNERTKRQKGK